MMSHLFQQQHFGEVRVKYRLARGLHPASDTLLGVELNMKQEVLLLITMLRMSESLSTDHLTFVARVSTQTVEGHVLRPVHELHGEDSLRGPGHRGHVEIRPGNFFYILIE